MIILKETQIVELSMTIRTVSNTERVSVEIKNDLITIRARSLQTEVYVKHAKQNVGCVVNALAIIVPDVYSSECDQFGSYLIKYLK